MDAPSQEVDERVRQNVFRDLEPSLLVVQTKVATSAVLGGLLSLMTCGQFGVGISSMAEAFSDRVHDSMGPLPCALICGTLYAIFPVIILRFMLCRPLQFKTIIHRRWSSLVVWLGGFGGAMASFGHHGSDLISFSAWVASALFAANLIGRIFEHFVPTWTVVGSHRLRSL